MASIKSRGVKVEVILRLTVKMDSISPKLLDLFWQSNMHVISYYCGVNQFSF